MVQILQKDNVKSGEYTKNYNTIDVFSYTLFIHNNDYQVAANYHKSEQSFVYILRCRIPI